MTEDSLGGLDYSGYPKPAFLCSLGGDPHHILLPEDHTVPVLGTFLPHNGDPQDSAFSPGIDDVCKLALVTPYLFLPRWWDEFRVLNSSSIKTKFGFSRPSHRRAETNLFRKLRCCNPFLENPDRFGSVLLFCNVNNNQ